MTITGPGKMSVAIVVVLTLVTILMGIISYMHESPIRPDRRHCPAQVKKCEDENHVYHLNTSKCHPIGASVNNLCGQNMAIYPVENCPIHGQCDCDYDNNSKYLVYHQDTDWCYFIYSQGPCKPGLVVKMLHNGTLSCEKKVKGESYTVIDRSKSFNTESASLFPFWPFGSSDGISGFVERKCYPGSHQDIRGQCQRTSQFVLNYPDENESEEYVDHSNY